VDYYLPAGRWTSFLSGETIEGGRWLREQNGTLSLPLMVRPNTVLPVGANEDRPDYDYADGVEYHVFALEEDVVAAARIEVSVQGACNPGAVLLRGIKAVASVTGGIAEKDSLGTRILSGHDSQNLVIHL
jgi:alpha-D-xyloside xylohydrolase